MPFKLRMRYTEAMRAQTTKLYNWAVAKAESDKAPFWIGLLFVMEIALFLPLDALLMFFCLQNRKRTLLYVLIATLASTVSGLVGYLVGHFLWDLVGPYVVPYLISAASFANISAHFQAYENWAVFIGALIPFPLKVLTISAGVFQLVVGQFIAWFMLGRLLRFSLVGGSVLIWGEKLKEFVDRHFHRILLIVGAKIAAVFLASSMLAV